MKYIGKAAIMRAESTVKNQVNGAKEDIEGRIGGRKKVDLDWK